MELETLVNFKTFKPNIVILRNEILRDDGLVRAVRIWGQIRPITVSDEDKCEIVEMEDPSKDKTTNVHHRYYYVSRG